MDQTQSFLTFGERVRGRRKILDLTQQQLARKVGISYSTIRKIETGDRRPSRQVARLLAQHLRVDPSLAEALKFMPQNDSENEGDRPNFSKYPIQSEVPAAARPLVGQGQDLETLQGLLGDPNCRVISLGGQGGGGETNPVMDIVDLVGRNRLATIILIIQGHLPSED